MTTTRETPMQTAFHPGEHLGLELTELNMTPSDLAEKLRVREDFLVDFLDQKFPITGDLAMRLGHYFGTSAQMWLNMQNHFDLEQAKWQSGAEIESLPTLQAA